MCKCASITGKDETRKDRGMRIFSVLGVQLSLWYINLPQMLSRWQEHYVRISVHMFSPEPKISGAQGICLSSRECDYMGLILPGY